MNVHGRTATHPSIRALSRAYRARAQDAERSVRAIVNEHEKVTHEHFGLGIKYEPTTE